LIKRLLFWILEEEEEEGKMMEMSDESSSNSGSTSTTTTMTTGKKALRVVICTSGSRGDTQPYIALGLACRAAGHSVRVAVEERLKPLVEEFGLEFFKIAGDPTAILWSKEAQVMLREGRVMSLMSKMEDYIAPYYQQALKDYESACEGADAIVSGPLCMSQTLSIAEKLRVPWIPVLLGPTMKTSEFPLFFLMQTNLGIGWINRATYATMFFMLWQNEKKKINAWRTQTLKLPPLDRWAQGLGGMFEDYPDLPLILGFNRNLFPNGAGAGGGNNSGPHMPLDYPRGSTLTGFLFVPETPEEKIDPELREFIKRCAEEGGDAPNNKPVYLGFGSMPAPNPRELVQMAIEVVTRLKCWAILCAGWSELTDIIASPEEEEQLQAEEAAGAGASNKGSSNNNSSSSRPAQKKLRVPKTLKIIKAAPHDWLLKRCSVVVHHCGVGTTGAALRSGAPSVPCPVMLDQPFFGSQLANLGVGTTPIPFPELTTDKLCQALRVALSSNKMKERAAAIADEIAKEEQVKGTKLAVEVIENAKIPPFWK